MREVCKAESQAGRLNQVCGGGFDQGRNQSGGVLAGDDLGWDPPHRNVWRYVFVDYRVGANRHIVADADSAE